MVKHTTAGDPGTNRTGESSSAASAASPYAGVTL